MFLFLFLSLSWMAQQIPKAKQVGSCIQNQIGKGMAIELRDAENQLNLILTCDDCGSMLSPA
jgi:hypothetical protein